MDMRPLSVSLMRRATKIFVFAFFAVMNPVQADPYEDIPVSVKSLDLGQPPSIEEIVAAGQLGGRLHPTSDAASVEQRDAANLDFGHAIEKWNRHEYRTAVQLFQEHIDRYPDSPWVDEAYLHMGCDATYSGRYVEAEKNFTTILNRSEGKAHPGALELATKARIRMGNLKSLQNNFPAASKYFTEASENASSGDWRTRTYSSHWIQRLSRYKGEQIAMANCGSQALARLLEKNGRLEEARAVADMLPVTERGFAAEDLSRIAASYGYQLSGRKIAGGELMKLPLPAIIPITPQNEGDGGHYWVLESIAGDQLIMFDPQSGRTFSQTAVELSQQWQGQVLVFSQEGQGLPGLQLAENEMQGIFGACCGLPRPEDNLGKPRGPEKKCPFPDNRCNKHGAPVWSVNSANMNFYVEDVPLWYTPAIGPEVEIGLSYNSQSATNRYEIFGNKWQFGYASYLVVDTRWQVNIYMPDGRRDLYKPLTSGGYIPPLAVYHTLVKLAENHFELRFKDGSVWVYSIPAGTTSLQPFLTQIRNARGQALRFGFDVNLRLTTITDAENRVTTLTYGANGLVTQVTDPFSRTARFTYDASRNLIGITDMGNYTTTFTYDASVYMTGMRGATGTWAFATRPAAGVFCTDQYPLPGQSMCENYQVKVTNPLGQTAEYWYDGYHRDSWYVSPRYFDPASTVATDASKKTVYDISGMTGEILRVTYPGGFSRNLGYDYGNLTSKSGPGGIPGTYRYTYGSYGTITAETTPTGLVNRFVYAANNIDLLSMTNPLGTASFAYNSFHELTSATDPLNRTTSFVWNSYGQLAAETDPLGAVTTYSYDPASKRLVRVSRGGLTLSAFTYDSLGRIATATDNEGVTFAYTYNALNDITRIAWPDGKFVQMAYSTQYPHLLVSHTDRGGRVTSYTHDGMQRVTAVTNPDGSQVRYEYDADGNMMSLADAMGNVTRFEHDPAGRIIKRTWADGRTETYTYSGFKIASITNSSNQTTTFGHNSLGKLYSIYRPTGGNVYLSYDIYGRLTQTSSNGKSSAYTYNAASELTSLDGPLANDTITYTYDGKGRHTGYSLQGGQAVSYNWDNLDRLTSVVVGGSSYSYTYSGASMAPSSLRRPSGVVSNFAYDSLKRLTWVTNQTSSASILNRYFYAYNTQDMRSGETVTIPGTVAPPFAQTPQTYAYNPLNQLTASATPARNYTYDAEGNQTGGYTPDGYAYMATFDAAHRLTSIQYTGALSVVYKTEYMYDASNFVVNRKEYAGGVKTADVNYVRIGSLILQERNATSNTVLREYVWGADMGGGVGGLLDLAQGGAHYGYLFDGRGNVTGVTDSAQAIAAHYVYDPFGNKVQQSGTLDQPYQFSTKHFDSRMGLYDFGYRFYNPQLGRWVNRDPIREDGGVNLYGFVRNNPVNYIDPLGLEGGWATFKKWVKRGWSGYKAQEQAFDIAQDIQDVEEAIEDKNPRSGFCLLRKALKYMPDVPIFKDVWEEGIKAGERGADIMEKSGENDPRFRDIEGFY